ncbi:hypothetical protein D6855_05755 [Butyrivibrio sp. CB08]|uniref:hypothetical protein n=1 Tax=Butyrivibrio sp. CB08 TaxID=2364879 RepID=UPI000EA93851|nr:hypothetical protein [Butyrivibrio sp. CB08]RKM61396.1 hypothetical protein D6855_05755 [Butyrivibrio sp. CB08]
MKKKLLLFVIGCTLALTGCGTGATSQEPAEQVEFESTVEASADDATEASAEDSSFDEEEFMGQELTPDASGRVSNGIFSIQMPEGTEGTYLAYNYENEINIYDKACYEDGYTGFAFGICLADDYGEYGGMRTKIGELTDESGKVHHVLISFPSEVQWDFNKSADAPATYSALYDNARDIAATLEPVGGGEYVDGGGCRGEEIYGDLVKEIVTTVKDAENSNELEEKELSPVYYAMTMGSHPEDPLLNIGVAYYDFNLDGVDEMVMGDMGNGQIYDIFGVVDGKPTHVTSGNWRDYYMLHGPVLSEHVSELASVSVVNTFELMPNSTELFPQYSLKLDETDGAQYKWSVSYDSGETWEEMTEDDYNDRLSNIMNFPTDKEVQFVPLGDFE